MDFLASSLIKHQEIAIFLSLALGYLIGKIKLGTFSLGPVVSTLLSAIAISILINTSGEAIKIPTVIQSLFFSIFIFAVGFKVGPQFVQGLKGGGINQSIVAVIFCILALGCTYLTSIIFSFDKGTAAGFLAGCFTQSAAVGSATDAINELTINASEKNQLLNNLTVSFALTFVFGTAGIPWWMTKVMPKIIGKDLKEECSKMEKELSINDKIEEGISSALSPYIIRSYRVTNELMNDKKISELESYRPNQRITIERIRREGKILEAKPDDIIKTGDIIAIEGNREELLKLLDTIGEEVDDQELLDFPIEESAIIITNKEIDNKKLKDFRSENIRGVRLKSIIRAGNDMPFSPNTEIHRGDTVTLIGIKKNVDKIAAFIGFTDKDTTQTDITTIGIGLAIGALIGIPAILIGNVKVSLSTSVGILLLAVFLGWLRSVWPVFGKFPAPALWVFESVGLSSFMAVVGLNSGSQFIQGLLDKGLVVLLSGIVVALLPPTICFLLGHYLFKFNLGINLGVISGSDTATPVLSASEELGDSKIPSLGFTVAYAIANILLTSWGPIVIAIIP